MAINILGINHKTAPVALREKVAFSEERYVFPTPITGTEDDDRDDEHEGENEAPKRRVAL